jgi:hypothetical protein
MKKYESLNTIVSLLILSISIFTIQSVHATVGGETLIGNFEYNPANESVYYSLADGGGRGCPPQLVALSLNSEKTSIKFSCDEGEKLSLEQVYSKITAITNGFKPLVPLSLKNNAITVDVNYVNDKTYGAGSNDILLRHFTASIYKNGKKIKEFPLTGCLVDQPFTFQGYSIPGFNKKIVLLISAINNCAEGGYIYESLQIIGGVDNLDKTVTDNFHKGMFPLSPNSGNLVIHESDKVNTVDSTIKENIISTSTTINKELTKPPVSVPATVTTEEVRTESFFVKIINWFRNLF